MILVIVSKAQNAQHGLNEENRDEILHNSGEESRKLVKEPLRSQDKRKKKLRKKSGLPMEVLYYSRKKVTFKITYCYISIKATNFILNSIILN